jgi:D-threo-aldose 1-dehydrogenase
LILEYTVNSKLRRKVGQTNIEVSQIGFGAAPLGGFRGKIPEQEVTVTLQFALDAGVNLFDTSPYYGYGRSELRVGHFLRDLPRDQYVLSTKVGRWLEPLDTKNPPADLRSGGLPFQPRFDYSASGTHRSLEQSMMRLGIPEIDIVYIHDVDIFTHIHSDVVEQHYKEVMEGCYPELEKLRASGVIKAIGVGINNTEMALRFAQDTDIDCILLAGRYTLLEQEPLDTLLPYCVDQEIGIVLGGPYNSGVLATGLGDNAKYDYGAVPEHIATKVTALQNVCKRHGVDLISAALQFPLAHKAVVSVIPGTMSLAEQQANIAAINKPIPTDFWKDLKVEDLLRADAPVPE